MKNAVGKAWRWIVKAWVWFESKIRRVAIIDEGFTFAAEMGKRSIPTNAASISFYFFLSAVPFAILICSQLPYTGISSEALIETVTKLTPDSVDALVESVILEAYTSRIALFSASLLVLIWSSAKVVTALIRSLDSIYHQDDKRNYFVVTGNSLLYTASLLLGSVGVLFLFAHGKTAEEFLLGLLPSKDISTAFQLHWHRVLVVAVTVLFFSFVYTVFPAGRRNFFHQLPGAVLAQMGILIISAFYSAYNIRRNVYSSFYGSLSAMAIFLVWLYACVMIFLLGGVFNVHYQSHISSAFGKIKKKNK